MRKNQLLFCYATALVWLCCAPAVHAQEAGTRREDAIAWINIAAQKKVAKHTELTLTQSLRLDHNMMHVRSALTDAALVYGVTKHTDIIVRGRFTYRPDKNTTSYRASAGMRYNRRVKPFDFSTRLLYQRDMSEGRAADNVVRVRAQAQFSRKKIPFAPYLYAEAFYGFNAGYHSLTRMRCCLGCDYRLAKRHDITLACMVQDSYWAKTPKRDFIYSVAYKVKLAKAKPDKKGETETAE